VTTAIYIIGGPGVGKSTVMAELMSGWEPGEYVRLTEREFFGHYLEHPVLGRGLYLGRLREQYPGTDALSLSVQPQALKWAESISSDLTMVFGEGSRLANLAFLSALGRQTQLLVVHLTAGEEIARERRSQRPDDGNWKTGQRDTQSEVWVRAQTSRAANLAKALRDRARFLNIVDIDTTDKNPKQIVEELCSAL
jgi:GTPase SAR1 family protein